MPVRAHSTGPAAVFVVPVSRNHLGGVYVNSVPMILGWCERSPEIVIENYATPLYNTLGGVELPYTYYPQGAEAVITCTFTRWNDFLATSLENIIRDTLVLEHSLFTNLSCLGLGIFYTYPAATFNSIFYSGHRSVEIFPFVRIVDVVRHEQGTMGEKITMVFAAQRVHVGTRPHFLTDMNDPILKETLKIYNPYSGLGEMHLGGGGDNEVLIPNPEGQGSAPIITASMFVVYPSIFPLEV